MSITIFTADDGVHGRELWRTDGTALGTVMVADIVPGAASSNPDAPVKIGDTAYFIAGADTRQLWRTDGTQAGTYLVSSAAIAIGGATTTTTPIATAGGEVFFAGRDAAYASGLYASDGTAAGTSFLAKVNSISQLTALGGKLFFIGSDNVHGAEVWVSDGTAAGTHVLKETVAGNNSVAPDDLTVFNGKLYFDVVDSGLWVSDGTEAGTTRLAIIAASPAASATVNNLTVVNGKLVFQSSAGGSGAYWSMDAGGVFAKLAPTSDILNNYSAGVFGNKFYFDDTRGSSAQSLYVTDSTAAGTVLVANVDHAQVLADFGGRLVFSGGFQTQGATGLYVSDGTPGGTTRIGAGSTSDPAILNGKVYFAFQSSVGAAAGLWVSDGTVAGTHLVLQAAPVGPITVSQGRLLFSAGSDLNGVELWTSDGTAAGTYQVDNIDPPNPSGSLFVQSDIAFGDRLIFQGMSTAGFSAPWISDGTLAGTYQIKADGTPSITGIGGFRTVGGREVFTGHTADGASQLWSTSGAAGDLTTLASAANGFPGSPYALFTNFTVYHNNLYFNYSNLTVSGPSQLYVTTGVAGSVAPVGAITSSGPAAILGDRMLFFGGVGGASGLVSSDGTAAGTTLLSSLQPYSSSAPIVSGSLAYFAATQAAGGGLDRELWVSDGTAAGTRRVADINPTPLGGSDPTKLIAFKGGVAFLANDGVHGQELWFSNGTAAGTFMAADIHPGSTSTSIVDFAAVGDTLYFDWADDAHGRQIWSFNGTPGGAALAVDLGVSSPQALGGPLTAFAGSLYFTDGFGSGMVLKQYNPVTAATRTVSSVSAGAPAETPVAAGGKLFYSTVDPSDGSAHLFVYDGVSASPTLLKTLGGIGTTSFNAVGGLLYFQGGDAVNGYELWKSDGTAAGTVRITNTSYDGGSNPSGFADLGATVAPADPTYSALYDAYTYMLRQAPMGTQLGAVASLAGQVGGGALTLAAAIGQIAGQADATTSVATLAYEFFTGHIPSAAGLDYLVSATGPNTANLNSAYYQTFNLENRYINFAVNLGKLGEGKAAFMSTYGNLSLFDATKAAYATIFGSAPTDAKVHALIDTRADYFAAYGQDGPTGIGTKAAMVGWLLAEAVKADVGTYATANDAFMADLADGTVGYAVDIVGVYGGTAYHG